MQTKTNLLKEIKKSINSDSNADKLVTRIKNNEIKEELEGKGRIERNKIDF